ncbi:DUF3558 domain-containing protein [Amycolatopsis aidingensis]|uniref:DUF3558 domain-containing protein n=1 Tax=Amycolatopsis aidingensis TaxID=2842453 RepID=UPI001C0CFA79|nr:DUF3558 domain-containing protein [Amycolatopsis aidingensis]
MRHFLLIVLAMLTLILTGCSSGEVKGTPMPSSGSDGAGDVPQVTQPLDASRYVNDPCGLVPSPVLTGLGYTKPGDAKTSKADQMLAGPSCGWHVRGKMESLSVGLQTGNRDAGAGGLAGLYAAFQDGQFGYYESAEPIDGYPAAYADGSDGRPRGYCRLWVGIADDLTFTVGASGYDTEQNSCGTARQVASAVLDTLKGG